MNVATEASANAVQRHSLKHRSDKRKKKLSNLFSAPTNIMTEKPAFRPLLIQPTIPSPTSQTASSISSKATPEANNEVDSDDEKKENLAKKAVRQHFSAPKITKSSTSISSEKAMLDDNDGNTSSHQDEGESEAEAEDDGEDEQLDEQGNKTISSFDAMAQQAADVLAKRIEFLPAQDPKSHKPILPEKVSYPLIKLISRSARLRAEISALKQRANAALTGESSVMIDETCDLDKKSSSLASRALSSRSTYYFGKDFPYVDAPLFQEFGSVDHLLHWPVASSVRVGPGFHNLGNTCFLNSALQALMYAPAFAQWLYLSASTAARAAYDAGSVEDFIPAKKHKGTLPQPPGFESHLHLGESSEDNLKNSKENHPVRVRPTIFTNEEGRFDRSEVLIQDIIARDPHRKQCPLTLQGKFCALCALQRLALYVHAPKPKKHISPRFIARRIRRIMESVSMFGSQEDAHECHIALLDKAHSAWVQAAFPNKNLKDIPIALQNTSPIYSLMSGILRSQIKCNVCKTQSNRYEYFIDLSLEIHNCTNLHDALRNFTKIEKLEGPNAYMCDKCKKKVSATKSYYVHKLPNVLSINFKRFAMGYDMMAMMGYGGRGGGGKKIKTHIDFPHTLNIQEYVSPSVRIATKKVRETRNTLITEEAFVHNPTLSETENMKRARAAKILKAAKAGEEELPRIIDVAIGSNEGGEMVESYSYTLTGVVVHSGNMSGGHYYAFVRARNGKWFVMDDESVIPVSEETVSQSDAYMLIYNKNTPSVPPTYAHVPSRAPIRSVKDAAVIAGTTGTSVGSGADADCGDGFSLHDINEDDVADTELEALLELVRCRVKKLEQESQDRAAKVKAIKTKTSEETATALHQAANGSGELSAKFVGGLAVLQAVDSDDEDEDEDDNNNNGCDEDEDQMIEEDESIANEDDLLEDDMIEDEDQTMEEDDHLEIERAYLKLDEGDEDEGEEDDEDEDNESVNEIGEVEDMEDMEEDEDVEEDVDENDEDESSLDLEDENFDYSAITPDILAVLTDEQREVYLDHFSKLSSKSSHAEEIDSDLEDGEVDRERIGLVYCESDEDEEEDDDALDMRMLDRMYKYGTDGRAAASTNVNVSSKIDKKKQDEKLREKIVNTDSSSTVSQAKTLPLSLSSLNSTLTSSSILKPSARASRFPISDSDSEASSVELQSLDLDETATVVVSQQRKTEQSDVITKKIQCNSVEVIPTTPIHSVHSKTTKENQTKLSEWSDSENEKDNDHNHTLAIRQKVTFSSSSGPAIVDQTLRSTDRPSGPSSKSQRGDGVTEEMLRRTKERQARKHAEKNALSRRQAIVEDQREQERNAKKAQAIFTSTAPRVETWDGTSSEALREHDVLERLLKREENAAAKNTMGYTRDEYDEELDQGRLKKIKKKDRGQQKIWGANQEFVANLQHGENKSYFKRAANGGSNETIESDKYSKLAKTARSHDVGTQKDASKEASRVGNAFQFVANAVQKTREENIYTRGVSARDIIKNAQHKRGGNFFGHRDGKNQYGADRSNTRGSHGRNNSHGNHGRGGKGHHGKPNHGHGKPNKPRK